MSEQEYFLKVRSTEEDRKLFDSVVKRVARGYMLIAITHAANPIKDKRTINALLENMQAALAENSSIDALTINKALESNFRFNEA